MTTGLTTNAPGRIMQPSGDTDAVIVRYIWRQSHPLAVTLRFLMDDEPPVEWTIARDLLNDALGDFTPHGEGDVTLTRVFPGTLVIHLENPHGACLIATTDDAARALIDRSLALVPAGEEQVDVDATIAQILGASHG